MRPKVPTDLALAPVAAEIDLNLQSLRDESVDGVFEGIALGLNAGAPGASRADRAAQVLEYATRSVDLHGWKATVSDDSTRLHLEGGSVTLDLALSATIERFVENGGTT
jgi:hypothetical protein